MKTTTELTKGNGVPSTSSTAENHSEKMAREYQQDPVAFAKKYGSQVRPPGFKDPKSRGVRVVGRMPGDFRDRRGW